jgi:hypothetical protein
MSRRNGDVFPGRQRVPIPPYVPLHITIRINIRWKRNVFTNRSGVPDRRDPPGKIWWGDRSPVRKKEEGGYPPPHDPNAGNVPICACGMMSFHGKLLT